LKRIEMQYLKKYWKRIKFLEIGGGGSAALGALGALERLVELDNDALLNIKGLSGCSAGATVAVILSLNKLNIHASIVDVKAINWGAYESSGWRDMLYKQGRCERSVGRRMLEPLLARKGCRVTLTMAELWKISKLWLRIRAVNLKNGQIRYFDHHSTPNMYVVDVLWATAAIPWAHQPLLDGGNIFVDGGLRKNYCRNAFSTPNLTHGFSVQYNYSDFAGDAQWYMRQLKVQMCTARSKNINALVTSRCFFICCVMAFCWAPSVEAGHAQPQTTSLPTKRFVIQDLSIPLNIDVNGIVVNGRDAYDVWALQMLRTEMFAVMLFSDILK